MGKRLKERHNNDRRTLRLLADNYENDDVGEMKKLLFDKYKTDYEDEQYLTNNPYDDFYTNEEEDPITQE